MRVFSIKVLKEKLGELAELAANGESLSITKYNKPYIMIIPSDAENVNRGNDLDSPLKPATKLASKGAFLDILIKDRYGEG